MTDDEQDRLYETGQRQVWTALLAQCLYNLGYDEWPLARWCKEREETLALLRLFCAEHGDNEWDPDLHLADIVEKHLWRHLDGVRRKGLSHVADG